VWLRATRTSRRQQRPAHPRQAAAEPSIGVNWLSETGTNGGRSMYIALTQTLRVTFNDSCPSSPSALWEDKTFPTTARSPLIRSSTRITRITIRRPRTIVSQLVLGTGSFSTDSAYTDNDGDSWLQSQGAGIDRASITRPSAVVDPFHAPVPLALFTRTRMYYCAQLPGSACALSIDGGRPSDRPLRPLCRRNAAGCTVTSK
jgi:hypothetical protein